MCFVIPSIPMVSAAEAASFRGPVIRYVVEQRQQAAIKEGRRLEREEIASLIRGCLDTQTKIPSFGFLPNPLVPALCAVLAAIEARSK